MRLRCGLFFGRIGSNTALRGLGGPRWMLGPESTELRTGFGKAMDSKFTPVESGIGGP